MNAEIATALSVGFFVGFGVAVIIFVIVSVREENEASRKLEEERAREAFKSEIRQWLKDELEIRKMISETERMEMKK